MDLQRKNTSSTRYDIIINLLLFILFLEKEVINKKKNYALAEERERINLLDDAFNRY